MFLNHTRYASMIFGSMVLAGSVCAVNAPLPEIAAWEETPAWCPAYAKLFPLDYLAGSYTICENLPGMLMLHTNSGKTDRERLKKTDAPSGLRLEIPDFLKLEGVCVYETRGGKYPKWPVREQAIRRNGGPYRSYTVEFDSQFRTELSHWFKQQICLTAVPGSAGKSGVIRYQVTIGGKQLPMRQCDVTVLPPLPPNKNKTSSFYPMVWISASTSSFVPQAKQMIGYWSGLSGKLLVYDRRLRTSIDPEIYRQLKQKADRVMFLFYNEAFINLDLPDSPQQFYKDVSSGRMRGKLPMDVTNRKRVVNTLPIWYMVEDPDGLYDKYLTAGFTGIREKYPEIRQLIWDFEYYKVGYDPGNLERFGKYLGLKKTPTAFEAETKYASKFNDYMAGLCEKLVRKTTKKMREILPDVRWFLCSSMPKKGYNDALARTLLKSDAIVDGHIPMPYYSGKRFFDDINYCTTVLKKTFIALNNPAERYSTWFDLYSPLLLKQNMTAAAALGCGGFGFWPNDMLPGSYFQAVSEAFSDIAFAENFYLKGKRRDHALKIEPADLSVYRQNGNAVTIPYGASEIKHTIHEYNGEKLITVFNYSPLDSILKISLDTPCSVSTAEGKFFTSNGKTVLKDSFLCEIPARGYGQFKLSPAPVSGMETEPQETVRKKLDAKLQARGKRDPFSAFRKHPDRVKLKKHFHHDLSVVGLNNGQVEILLDFADGGSVRGVEFLGRKQLFTPNCYLGRFMFINAASINFYNGFQFDGIEAADNEITASFSCTVPESRGETHQLSGLQIRKSITLCKNNALVWRLHFRNPTKRVMPVEFRLHNIPCAGTANITVDKKLLTNAKAPLLSMFAVPGSQITFLNGRVKPAIWSRQPYTFEARREKVPYRWTFGSKGLAGVFFNNNRFFTVEPLSGIFLLNPGESREFEFTALPQLR